MSSKLSSQRMALKFPAKRDWSWKGQYWLDVGCGSNKQPHCVGMDKRKLDGVDIVHDCEVLPWPMADETFTRIIMSHLMEHLKPWLVNTIMDEMWRVLKPGGQLMLAMPYAGSFGFYQDPTHIKTWNEATPQYYDPDFPLYKVYEPKPWKIVTNTWNQATGLEVVLEVRKEA